MKAFNSEISNFSLSIKPNVLCFSGLDPSGGAGIQADIESLFSVGCHCLPIVTTLTVQDTRNVISSNAVESSILIAQARAILEDMPVSAIKIGLLPNIDTIELIHTLLIDHPHIPVILDPILTAGGGFNFTGSDMIDGLRLLLLPLITVVTPNTHELRKLAKDADTEDASANSLLDLGCEHVLLTGTHAESKSVINRLYSPHRPPLLFEWPRLKQEYHGSGCTLAASLAGYIAHGMMIDSAARAAQEFTWNSLNAGYECGRGQQLPNRSFWGEHNQP
jgi:hydroxymethylpyrimidine/phosphomethylpyrimidine kinase